jgi:hypothetical protein
MLVGCGASSPHVSPSDGSTTDSAAERGTSATDAGDAAPADARTMDVGAASDGAVDAIAGDSQDSQASEAGVVCGALANTASPIAATLVASLPTKAMGGPLTDGTYELIAAEETLSSAPAKFWRTFQISDGGTSFHWVVQDVGLPPEHHFAGTVKVMGTSLVFTEFCEGNALMNYGYDAQGTSFNLYFLFGAGGRLFHYRLKATP